MPHPTCPAGSPLLAHSSDVAVPARPPLPWPTPQYAAAPSGYGCVHPLRDVVAVPHQPHDTVWLQHTATMTLDELLAGKKRCVPPSRGVCCEPAQPKDQGLCCAAPRTCSRGCLPAGCVAQRCQPVCRFAASQMLCLCTLGASARLACFNPGLQRVCSCSQACTMDSMACPDPGPPPFDAQHVFLCGRRAAPRSRIQRACTSDPAQSHAGVE